VFSTLHDCPIYGDHLSILERGESIKSLKSRVPPGVILLSKLNPEIERVWLVDIQTTDRAVCSTEFLVLHPRQPYGRAYVYCLLRSLRFRQQIEALVTGTSKSHQRAHAEAILSQPVTLPPIPLAREFEKIILPLLLQTIECRRESQAITVTCNMLLPKLVSGEILIKNAERFIEGCS